MVERQVELVGLLQWREWDRSRKEICSSIEAAYKSYPKDWGWEIDWVYGGLDDGFVEMLLFQSGSHLEECLNWKWNAAEGQCLKDMIATAPVAK